MQTISNADKTLLQGYAPVHLHLYVGGALIPAKLGSFQLTQSVGDEETTCGSSVASNVTFTADAEPIVRVLATHLDEAITTHDDLALVARFSWKQLVGLTCKFTWDVDGSTEYDLFTGKIEKTVVSGGRVTVTAQDELFWNGSKAFSNQSSYQTDSNASTVFSTIASIMGVSVNSATSTLLSSITISGGFSSCRDTLACYQAVGYIAGLAGGNAVINRSGELAVVKYHAVNFETEPYSGEASAENYDYTVSGVNFSRTYITNVTNPDGTKSESESLVNYKAGDGYLSMENPLANQAAANRAYNALRTFSSRKGSYSFPMGIELEPGDIITIHSMDGDYPVAINTIEFALDGGVKSTVHGAGQMYPNGVNGTVLVEQQTRSVLLKAGLSKSASGDDESGLVLTKSGEDETVQTRALSDDEDPIDVQPETTIPGRNGPITQRIESLELEMLRVKNLQAENAEITNANIQSLHAGNIDVDQLFAKDITATGSFSIDNSGVSMGIDTNGFTLRWKESNGYSWARLDNDLISFSRTLDSGEFGNNPPFITFGGGSDVGGGKMYLSAGDINLLSGYTPTEMFISADTMHLTGSYFPNQYGYRYGTVSVEGNVVPETTAMHNIGSSSSRWATIYATTVNIGGYNAIPRRSKTVTATTSSAGIVSLSLDSNYRVICVRRTDSASICHPYWGVAGQTWYCLVTTASATPSAVASTSVTLSVEYYAV